MQGPWRCGPLSGSLHLRSRAPQTVVHTRTPCTQLWPGACHMPALDPGREGWELSAQLRHGSLPIRRTTFSHAHSHGQGPAWGDPQAAAPRTSSRRLRRSCMGPSTPEGFWGDVGLCQQPGHGRGHSRRSVRGPNSASGQAQRGGDGEGGRARPRTPRVPSMSTAHRPPQPAASRRSQG